MRPCNYKRSIKGFRSGVYRAIWLTADNEIELNENTEMIAEFQLSKNDFRGVTLKFRAEREFHDEVLYANHDAGQASVSALLCTAYLYCIKNNTFGKDKFIYNCDGIY